jgi:hypothetical protein
MIVDAPVEVWGASVRVLHCPKCGEGAKKIAFGRGDVPDPQPIQNGMTDAEKRAAWLKMRDNGLSSECLADKMCGLVPTGNYPHDGDDFGRCERLLILYPDWRERLGEMRTVNKAWDALVERWDEIATSWRHDVELYRKAPRAKDGWLCYPLMRSILEPLEKSRVAR